ncbi:MAG: hypothetical protein KGL44_02990 [Sphingomonadales bacterium]|nr:hypothetical protein [Sphingomonadales bacterium]
MMQLIEANALAFGLVLLIGLLVAWWLFSRSGGERRRHYAPDVLDEGAAPAQRNQALIDAPSATAAALAGTGPDILGGVGEVIAVAAATEVRDAAGDDLTAIKGLGPKLAALLGTLGITTYAQIAALTDSDLDALDAKLGAFAGRPRRDNWVEQAEFLAASDTAGFEGKFGKL